jgi:hypothetical protein
MKRTFRKAAGVISCRRLGKIMHSPLICAFAAGSYGDHYRGGVCIGTLGCPYLSALGLSGRCVVRTGAASSTRVQEPH